METEASIDPEMVTAFGFDMILTSTIAITARPMYHAQKRLFAFFVVLIQLPLLVSAPHPSGSSPSKSPIPTAAAVVGMGIAAAGAGAISINSSMSTEDDMRPPSKKRRHCREAAAAAPALPVTIETRCQKEKQKRVDRERTGRKRDEMTPEEKDQARVKDKVATAKTRAKRSREEKNRANAKARVATAKSRAKMSPAKKDETSAKDRDAKAKKRAQRTPAEKDKARVKDKEAKEEQRKRKEIFCRGFIKDEERELHTVWILDKDEKNKIVPVAKFMFSEEVYEEEEGRGDRKFHRGKSKFVLVKSELDDDDIKFVKKKIQDGGFTFRHDRKKHGYGQKLYFRFGPMTRYPIIDSYAMSGKKEIPKDGREPFDDIDDEMILETSFYLGKMDKECYYCQARGFSGEIQNKIKGDDMIEGNEFVDFGSLCCKSGKVKGIRDYNLPTELEKLYTDQQDEDAKRFRKKSRLFNNGMAMCSVAAEKGWKNRCNNNKTDCMLTASGQLYRRVGPLQPKQGENPKCVQCFFYGPEEAAKHRAFNSFGGQKKTRRESLMDKRIFVKLHNILIRAKNKYIETFLGVKDYIEKNLKDKVRDIVLALHANESTDTLIHEGRLNAPQVKEVALLMPNEMNASQERLLTFNYATPEDCAGLQFIPDFHRSYDALQYPLLFPDGQDGWHFNLDHTMLEHINYMMMDREGITNPILCGNGVGHQFILDQYCKVELERLRWVELNQKTIRAENYSGLADSVKSKEDLQNTGTRVVLPSTFVGGDRYMHQQYLDSMALFQRYGRPHLFITITANPEWAEIQENLMPGQTALDRPDIVARVFKLKKQQLIREICGDAIFGKNVARTHCIEFQKRGFPHAHILIWLDEDTHPNSNLIDKIICAEIPSKYITIPGDEKNEKREVKVKNPLHTRVTSTNLHGPCGDHDPTRSCMRGGVCKNNYPKEYAAMTEMNEDGYPRYQRRSPEEEGNVFTAYRKNKEHTYTNADVVPYSKYLTLRFNCHINVEWCNSISAIKYLFGYINKGCDQATVEVQGSKEGDWTGIAEVQAQVENEVLEYKTKRYISIGEGCWRLQQNEIAERRPAVFRLNVHLPDQQTVYFNPDDYDLENFQHKLERSRRTPLTAYFELNRNLKANASKPDATEDMKSEWEETGKLLFRKIPEKYTWDAKEKAWKRRKRGELQIGRVYTVHPTELERYSLRLLLNHVPGVTSFDDLKMVMVDGKEKFCDSFHEAAIARNLVRDDHMWIECMKEESQTQTNIFRLRSLFTTILLHCDVGKPGAFYDACKADLMSNYVHKYREEFVKHPQLKHLVDKCHPVEIPGNNFNDPEWPLEKYAENTCLVHIRLLLSKANREMGEFHLPEPDMEREQQLQGVLGDRSTTSSHEFTKERAKEFFEENYCKLNKEQLHVVETVQKLVKEYSEISESGTIAGELKEFVAFLDAPGGTGKTFTLNVLINWLVMNEKPVASTAASGIAATVLHNGRTCHNRFNFPIDITADSTCREDSDLVSFLKEVQLIIIDEATMLDKWYYEALDKTLRYITGQKETKFGGKVVLISGDFRQLLEVIPGANRAKTVSRCLKGSNKLWDGDIIHLQLRDNMRVKNALEQHPNDDDFEEQLRWYEKWLLDLGEGKLPTLGHNIVQIPRSMCVDSKEDVINQVFDNFENNIGDPEYFQSRAIVAATNEVVNEVNDMLTELLPGEVKTFKSIDTVGDDDNPTSFPSEYLNSLHISGMPDHEIHLKLDSIVILLRNMDIDAGHANGQRYKVIGIGEYRIVLKKLYSKGDGNDIFVLPRIPMASSGTKLPFVLRRLQFPVKVAFALTINRAQSQTFSKCGILLPTSTWTHGQIYVIFSRCGNPKGVYVWADQKEFKELFDSGQLPSGEIFMRNIVYREVLY